MLVLSSVDFFFQIQLFPKILLAIPSECQIVWVQIRLQILSFLSWVKTVCKGYQQMILVGRELGQVGRTRVKLGKFGHTFANSVNPDETFHQDFHCLLS